MRKLFVLLFFRLLYCRNLLQFKSVGRQADVDKSKYCKKPVYRENHKLMCLSTLFPFRRFPVLHQCISLQITEINIIGFWLVGSDITVALCLHLLRVEMILIFWLAISKNNIFTVFFPFLFTLYWMLCT